MLSARAVQRTVALASAAAAVTGCAFLIGLEEHALREGLGDGEAPTDGPSPDGSALCGGETCHEGYTCIDGKVCGNRVVEVTGGWTFSCALLAAGQVWCWGDNQFMELGVPTPNIDKACGELRCSPRPVRVDVAEITQVTAGAVHACALRKGGAVVCWGSGSFGNIGRPPFDLPLCPGGQPGQATFCAGPTVVPFPTGVTVVQVAGGFNSTCARTTDGEIWCWGDNIVGAAGQKPPLPDGGPRDGATRSFHEPKKVQGIAGAVDLACGWDYNCCAVLGNGEARCWGGNRFSQLTVPPASVLYQCGHEMPCTDVPQVVRADDAGAALGQIAKIATGGETMLALRTDGTVWSWGASYWGNLGDGTIAIDPLGHMFPQQVAVPPAAQLYASVAAFLAVDRQGGLHTWGINASGQTAQGTTTGAACGDGDAGGTCVPTPGRVGAIGPVSQAGVKFGHGIALQTDGTVLVWGDNAFAQLGHLPGTEGDQPCTPGPCQPSPRPVQGLP